MRFTVGAVVILAGLVVPPVANAVPAKGPDPVVVVNDRSNPVFATLVDTPAVAIANAVQIAGTPLVKLDTSAGSIPVQQQGPMSVQGTVAIDPNHNTVTLADSPAAAPPPEPYQKVVEVNQARTPSECVAIPVPAGRTLRIDNVGVEAFANTVSAAQDLNVGIRIGDPRMLNAVTHPVELSGDGALQRGQAEMTLLLGVLEQPDELVLNGSICLTEARAGSTPTFVATITGELLQP